jgi:hypothetical protein
MATVVMLVVFLFFFIVGAVMLFFPLKAYRLSGGSIYTQEFLNRFTTRVGTRATGVLFMLFVIATCPAVFRSRHSELEARLFAAWMVLFGLVWVSGVVLGFVTWISPKAKAWASSYSTDKVTNRQHRIEIVIGLAAMLSSVAWAALALIVP